MMLRDHDRDSYRNYRMFFQVALTLYLGVALGTVSGIELLHQIGQWLLPFMLLVTLFFWKMLIQKTDFSYVGEAINKSQKRRAGKLPTSCFTFLLRLKTADEQEDETPND